MNDRRIGPLRADVPTNVVRICFFIVFAMNVQCAMSFIMFPGDFASAYQLDGVEGNVAIQGIGIAFLMWNATYPAFIVSPRKFEILGWVVLVQQIIGFIGESAILLGLQGISDYDLLASSILRFIVFDGVGLILMAASFLFMLLRDNEPR